MRRVCGVAGAVQRHEVRPPEQFVHRHGGGAAPGDLLLGQVGVGGEHRHPEGPRELGDAAADVADADQAEGLAADLAAHQVLAAVAAVPPQPAVVLGDALGEVEHQPQRVLGDRRGVGARLVHDEHAGPGAGGDVDGVVAGADRGHAEQPGAAFEQLRAGEPLPRQLVLRRGDLVGVGLGQVRPGALLRPGEVAGPQLDVGLAREPLGHRRVVMEVEAHHDLVLLSHRFLLPHRVCAAQSLRGQDRHRAQARRRPALARCSTDGLLRPASLRFGFPRRRPACSATAV